MRTRPHQRFAQRETVDADVEKAADGSSEYGDENGGRNRHRGGGSTCSSGAAAGSVGKGQRSDASATPISPVSGSRRYGVPDGSSGNPRTAPAAASCSHDSARVPVRFV